MTKREFLGRQGLLTVAPAAVAVGTKVCSCAYHPGRVPVMVVRKDGTMEGI